MVFSTWAQYTTLQGWLSKYRLVDSNLESELQRYSRSATMGGFDLNLDLIIPNGYDCQDIEKVGINIDDRRVEASIFLGTKVPEHWVRTVSLIIPVVKRDRAA